MSDYHYTPMYGVDPDSSEVIWIKDSKPPMARVEEVNMLIEQLVEKFGPIQIECAKGDCAVRVPDVGVFHADTLIEALRFAWERVDIL